MIVTKGIPNQLNIRNEASENQLVNHKKKKLKKKAIIHSIAWYLRLSFSDFGK